MPTETDVSFKHDVRLVMPSYLKQLIITNKMLQRTDLESRRWNYEVVGRSTTFPSSAQFPEALVLTGSHLMFFSDLH